MRTNLTRGMVLALILLVITLVSTTVLGAEQEITLKLWLSGNFQGFLDEYIPRFEEANPGIKVEYQTLDWASNIQKILIAMSGGAGPDVVSVYSTDVAPMVDKGVFIPLDKYVDTADFPDNYLEVGRWNDQIYAMPLTMVVRPFYFRTDYLKEAGIEAAPQSWDDLREAAKALTLRDDRGNLKRVGFWVPTNHPYKTYSVWWAFLLNNGGQFFDETGDIAWDSPEGIEAARLFQDLVQVDEVDEPGSVKIDNVDYTQGRVAMLLSTLISRQLPAEFMDKTDVIVPPYNKTPVVEAGSDVIGITTRSKHPEAAAKLVNFLTTNIEANVEYSKIEGGIPPTYKAQKTDYVTNNKLISKIKELGNKYGRALPRNPKLLEVADILTDALDRIIVDNASPEKTLKKAAAEARKLLK